MIVQFNQKCYKVLSMVIKSYLYDVNFCNKELTSCSTGISNNYNVFIITSSYHPLYHKQMHSSTLWEVFCVHFHSNVTVWILHTPEKLIGM